MRGYRPKKRETVVWAALKLQKYRRLPEQEWVKALVSR